MDQQQSTRPERPSVPGPGEPTERLTTEPPAGQAGGPAQSSGAPQPGLYDAAWQQGGQPAPGWGAPQQDRQQPAQGWGAPERVYPQQAGGWGAPAPSAQRSAGARWRGLSTTQKGLAAGAAALVIAGGAGAAVWAATSANAGTNGNALGAQGGLGQGPGGQTGQNGAQNGAQNGQGFGAGGGRNLGAGGLGVGMLGQVLHGEFVVVQDNATVTMLEQTGSVTAVSGQSVTVKSTDGFTQTYAISSSTQIGSRGTRGQSGTGSSGTGSSTSLAQGQTVTVAALKDGLAAQTILITGTN